MIHIGIDNGVSGSIGIVNGKSAFYCPMPVEKDLNYTKKKAFFNRVNVNELMNLLKPYVQADQCFCVLERPMKNPGRFAATISAVRALEATEIVLKLLKVPRSYIDSKEWQKGLLPSGLWRTVKDKNGRDRLKADPAELKLASLEIGKRLFPSINFNGMKDADGLLIAEYARRNRL